MLISVKAVKFMFEFSKDYLCEHVFPSPFKMKIKFRNKLLHTTCLKLTNTQPDKRKLFLVKHTPLLIRDTIQLSVCNIIYIYIGQ